MFEKVQAMLADALGLSASEIKPESRIIEDLGADSLDVVELLSRLEDEYGVTIPDDDVENLKTVIHPKSCKRIAMTVSIRKAIVRKYSTRIAKEILSLWFRNCSFSV